jgi:hypothetical protein
MAYAGVGAGVSKSMGRVQERVRTLVPTGRREHIRERAKQDRVRERAR